MSQESQKALPDALSRGASLKQLSLLNLWRSYCRHHVSSARDSLNRLLRQPLSSLMTCLVVAIALALPQVLSVAVSNIDQLGQSWQGRPSLSVYLHHNVKQPVAEKLLIELEQQESVAEGIYISPSEALQEFEAHSGFADVLGQLERNPLPPLLQLSLVEQLSLEQVQSLQANLQARPEVEQVDVDLQWLQRLQQILALGRTLIWLLSGLLALGVLLIVGNTIRLAIAARKDEILVTKTLGGTNAFVRRPFLYTGLWYGLLGGALALLLTELCLFALAGPVAKLAGSYGSDFLLMGISWFDAGFLLLASSVLGWLGAALAVGRHLAAIEPK
ncbi:permease-like cell division protein FtsX [uncultured Pseudoteredinibacter sp.]|uniref:permease-like cell division protein FtsX n=1 Tax=uncultured Pseudoteredinibacter sp. TaxID=1641701 RepID=UPI002606678F|nr:permease-like cell division protein FtsX [uncultured Pseudoteredinibacter sp.]